MGVLVVVMGRGTIAGCLVPGKWDEKYQRLTERKKRQYTMLYIFIY